MIPQYGNRPGDPGAVAMLSFDCAGGARSPKLR